MEIIKKIEGIGKQRGAALAKAGVRSLDDLRRMDIEAISQATGIGKGLLSPFKAMAELQLIPDIDPQLSNVLVSKGNIYGLAPLAKSSPSELQDIISASIKEGIIPEKYNALGGGDFQSWTKIALALSCYEQLRSDREYLNYLIGLSGDTPLELEKRYHQHFIESEDENSPIKTTKICIEVLQADLDEKKQSNPNYEYKSQEDWTEETGDTSDYGYLQYLLSIEAQSEDEKAIKKKAHLLSERFKVNFFVDPLEITTRVRQAILTLQAVIRERGIIREFVFQGEDEELTHDIGEIMPDSDASNGQAWIIHQQATCILCQYESETLRNEGYPFSDGKATFRLKIDDNKKDNLPILKISVTGYWPDKEQEMLISERVITRGEFLEANTYQDFLLPFSGFHHGYINFQIKAKIEWFGTTNIWAASMKFELNPYIPHLDGGYYYDNPIVGFCPAQPGDCGTIVKDRDGAREIDVVFAESFAGYACVSPMISGVVGENEASFRIAIQKEFYAPWRPNSLGATLEICEENGDVLSVKDIFVSDFTHWYGWPSLDRTKYQDFIVSFKLGRENKFFFRIYWHNNITLRIDKITIMPKTLYRAEWTELQDEFDFPENFLTLKSSMIKGKESFEQVLDEAYKILSESTLTVTVTKRDYSESFTIEKNLNDEKLKFLLDRFNKWASSISDMMGIETAILEGHRRFFHEEYSLALKKYVMAEEQIRSIFQNVFLPFQLLGIPKNLESLSQEVGSLARNEVRAKIKKMIDLIMLGAHMPLLFDLFQPFTGMGVSKFWRNVWPEIAGATFKEKSGKRRDAKRFIELEESLIINLTDFIDKILKVHEFSWSKEEEKPVEEIDSIKKVDIELEYNDVDFIVETFDPDKHHLLPQSFYEAKIVFPEYPIKDISDLTKSKINVNIIYPRPLLEITGYLIGILAHHYFHTLPLAIGDAYNKIGFFQKAKNYYDLLYDEFSQIQQEICSFKVIKGEWDITPNNITLKKKATPAYVIAGKKYWTDYSIELEARKIDGSEGFLILFRYQDEGDWLWWNIGGWGNTKSAIEYDKWGANQIVNGSVSPNINNITSDYWYKIRIAVSGNKISCSIDGKTVECALPNKVHFRGCIGLGAWDSLVEYRNIKVTPLNPKAVYPYLNASIEYPLMAIRMAQNYIDWGNFLYRQQDAESIQRAKEMYKKALQVHAALEWCKEDLYGIMEVAVGGLIEAPLPLKVIGEVINTIEELKYTKDSAKVKETYKNIANIATSDIAKESMVAELSSLLNRDFTKYWKDIIIVEEPLRGSIERTLMPATQTNRSMISAYALCARRTQVGYEASKGDIVPFGAPPPICTPENPIILKQKREACLRIYMIDQGLNFLGFRNNYLSIFRYVYLVEQAKAFANLALSAERDFLSFKEKFESESLTNLQAEQTLALALATVQLEELRRIEAKDKLSLSRMQVNLVNAMINELKKKLEEIDWFDYVESVVSTLIPIIKGAKETKKDVSEFATKTLGISAEAATAAGWGAVVVHAGIEIAQGISAIEDQKDSLENQIGRLRAHDLPLAKQNMQVGKDRLMIAVRQKDIAIMKAGFSQDILEFLKGKFLNEELWSYLARSIKEIYELYMEYSIALAWLAERALEFERGSEINRIRFNYFSAERQGLLAAENLIKDITSLEYDKLATEGKKIPVKQVISLARFYPHQFSSFLKTGKTEFYIPLEFFDSLYPGLYQARIKNIELQVIGALPLSEPHATLTNLGVSRIRTLDYKAEGKKFVEMAIYNPSETIALSGYAIKEDQLMFRPSEGEKVLYPFEGLGIDSYWVLDMSKQANAVDFSQIIDVQLAIYYTAQYDEDLKNNILEEFPRFKAYIQPFSLQYKTAEQFVKFIEPSNNDRGRDMRILSFETAEADFPANQMERRIRNLYFFIKGRDGEITPLTMHIFSAQHPEVVKVTFSERGLIASNIGADDQDTNPSPLNVFANLNVEDRWYLKILPEDNPDLLKKNAAGNVVSDPDNGFLRVRGPDSGTAFPNIVEWPNDLYITTKVRLNKRLVRFIFRKSVDGEYHVDFSKNGLYLYKNEVIELLPEPKYKRTLLWEDKTFHLENTWHEIRILVIQDLIQLFVDGLERIKYKDQDHPFTEGSFTLNPINESSDSYVDMDDFQIQEVDQFGIVKGDLFKDHFTDENIREKWYIESEHIDKWQVSNEEDVVNPTLDLTFMEDILLLMEYEYRLPGPPLLHLEPEMLDFGKIDTGRVKRLLAQLENTGGSELLILRIERFLPHGFHVELPEGISPENPLRLQPGEHLTVPVAFQPVSAGTIYGSIVIHSNDARSGYESRVLAFVGQGISPQLSITPEELNFGEVCLGTSRQLKLRLSNMGEADLLLNEIDLSGKYFSANLPNSLRLKPGRHEEWTISFAPPLEGEKTGTLSFNSNDPNKPTMEIPLTGKGIHWLTASPGTIDFGQVKVNQWTRPKELTLTNIGPSSCEITKIMAPAIGAKVKFKYLLPYKVPFALRQGQSLPIALSAKPTELGMQKGSLVITYSTNGISRSLIVNLKVIGT